MSAPAVAPPVESKRTLGAFDVGCVVVGGIIGVGIFFTPATVAARVDSPAQVVAAWALGGLVALLGALVSAELSRKVPGHGGTFLYIHEAFGRLPAFLYGWANWLVIQAGALGIIGLVMADNLDVMLYGEARTGEVGKVVVAVVAIVLFTLINALGLRAGSRVQNALTLTKTGAVGLLVVLALLAVGASGTPSVAAASEAPAPRGWLTALGAALLPVLFSYGGWQQGSFLAGAARRPLRDVPLGILGGVVIVVLAYVSVNVAFLHLLGLQGAAQSTAIAADAAGAALAPYGWGAAAARLLAGLVVVSALGIMNTCCLAPPFVLHAMARHGVFPSRLGALNARSGSPVLAVLVQGLWGAALLVTVHLASGRQTLGLLLDGIVCIDWIFYGLCGLALLRLRRRAPAGEPRLPLGGLVAGVFAAFSFVVTLAAIATNPRASLTGIGVCALGWVVYRGVWRRRA